MLKFKRIAAALCSAVFAIGMTAALPQKEQDTVKAASSIVAFPGAVGGGKYATGGRGGEVYHVTNLNDSGAGSLRDAVSKSNRIVVFDVSGTIELKSNIVVSSNITIAGQTAPGGSGVTLKNYKLGLGGTNCIVRYISSRPGPYKATSSGNDALGGAGGSNSIIDHCSIGWASDEQWGLYSKNDNYTCQYTIIGPANSWGGHAKGVHGFGIMLGRSNVSYDHNLIIHCVSRNFRGKVPDQNAADFTNNIIYDWGYQTTYGTIGHVNYVNNTLKAGNSTTGGYHYAQVSNSDNFKVYLSGNRILNKDNSIRNHVNNWSAMTYKSGKTEATTRVDTPFQILTNGEDVSTVHTAESAEVSYDHVISFAGNGIAPDKRTAIDQQCADETLNGTGSCSGTAAYNSSVSDLNKYSIKCGVEYEYPSAVLKKEITDADNDGMADDWELARGLNPNDSSDYKGDYCGKGYMNIEYYINDLTVDSFPEGVVELSPSTPVVSISAFETIEAEDFSGQEGVTVEDNGNGKNVGYIENGDYIMFNSVDFEEGAKSFKVNAGTTAEDGKIELYLNNMNDSPIAVLPIENTGGWHNYTEISKTIPTITGKNKVYLKFTGGEGYLLNIDSFVFGKEAIPMSGKLISNLTVYDEANMANWSIVENLSEDMLVYGDRDNVYSTVPKQVKGAEYIKLACDSKAYTEDLASFTAAEDITVYVGFDSRITAIPSWAQTWTKTSLTLGNNKGVIFNLYSLSVKKGEKVTLGTNGQTSGCVNYVAFAVAANESSEKIIGNVNADGEFGIADAVMMQKYLLGSGTLTDWEAGDLCKDGKIDVFDMCLIRELIIS